MHILISSTMISTLYRDKNTHIDWIDNPFHDVTTVDEKYQFTCMIDFRRIFCDGANVERINFRSGIVGNVKNTLLPLYLTNHSDFRKVPHIINEFYPLFGCGWYSRSRISGGCYWFITSWSLSHCRGCVTCIIYIFVILERNENENPSLILFLYKEK